MGAHLSTIQNTLRERFQQCDVEGKGYLTLGQMMSMQPQFGVSSCHLGVLFMIDRCQPASQHPLQRTGSCQHSSKHPPLLLLHIPSTPRNLDAVFTLEALRDFALLAYNYARVHRNQEPFMVTGYASLKLWSALNQDQEEVVEWYGPVPLGWCCAGMAAGSARHACAWLHNITRC